MMRWNFLWIALFPLVLSAQTGFVSPDSLVKFSSHFLVYDYNDSLKFSENELFIQGMEDLLEDPESFSREFPDMPGISVITDEDGKFRIFSWLVLTAEGYQPFGIVQMKEGKKGLCTVERLTNSSEEVRSIKYRTLTPDKWYGAVYYDMIPMTHKKEQYYILLGFTPNDGITHKKVIDVLHFSGKSVKFGKSVFTDVEGRMQNRVIFEYSAMARMSLSYNEKDKMIEFDHLSPPDPALKDQYQFYGPDFSYDAYELKSGEWLYKEDIDARNEGENLGQDGIHYNLELPADTTGTN